MGVTIHYKGTLHDLRTVGKLIYELQDFAQLLGWRNQRWNGDWSKPNTSRLSRNGEGLCITGLVPLQGITVYPHKDCEPLHLTFDSLGNLEDPVGMAILAEGERGRRERWLSTKTQFAPLKVHAGIMNLLRYLKNHYILDMEVLDEGGYWESSDIHDLKRRRDTIDHALDILGAALSADRARGSPSSSPEDLVQRIQRILKEEFGRNDG